MIKRLIKKQNLDDVAKISHDLFYRKISPTGSTVHYSRGTGCPSISLFMVVVRNAVSAKRA